MYTPLNWTTTQRHVAFASFTSWMLDAFDFFILVFVLAISPNGFTLPYRTFPLRLC